MKQFVHKLKVGDVVSASVVEATGGHDFIINFEGDLMRVANHSGRHLTVGQSVALVVTAIQPLAFRMCRERVQGLDRRI